MSSYNNENFNPNLLAQSVSSVASNTSRSFDQHNGKYDNSVSQIKNRESIMKVFVNDIQDINAINECGWTPLYRTIIGGNNKATEILLKHGADPNIKCSMGETALFQAVEMESLSQVETLLKFKTDPNIPQADGLIPLHTATLKQNIQIVELLLKYGSNPNYENKLFLQTPVHYAIKHSVKPAILMLLVRYNGSLSIRDKNKKRPIDYVESDEIRDTLNMLKLEKEDAFKTPQKQSNISYLNNTTGQKRNSGLNFTPSKTSNYVFNKLVRTASDSKELNYNNTGGNIQTNLFSNICNEHEFRLEENEENKRRDSDNILIQNQYINTSKDLNYSQTEYINTCNNNDNNFTINMENRFDSFVTKEGVPMSKLNTPNPNEDGGLSDMNPLDTLYSNGNTIRSNHNSLIKNVEQASHGVRRDIFYNNKNTRSRANTPENKDNQSIPQITENDNEESPEKKDRVSEFIDDSLEENEELVPMDLMNAKLNQVEYAAGLQDELYNSSSKNDKTEVEITYTPSKISYIISEVPLTSKKKNNNELSVIEKPNCHFKNNSDIHHSDNQQIIKKINFNKIKYHNKANEGNKEMINTNSYQISDNNSAMNLCNNLSKNNNNSTQNMQNNQNNQNKNLKNTIHLSDLEIKLNSNNYLPSPQERKINLSPSYKKRLSFSKGKAISPTNSVQNSYRNITCGSNCNAQMAIPYNTLVSADEEKMNNKNTAPTSTRQTSAQYYMEDNYPPREKCRKSNNLNETINTGQEFSGSNRTIIHYGEAGSNKIQKLKKISVLTNYSRRNSPKSFCRRSPGGDYLDTIYCMNTESSRSNISTVDAKKLHDWLNSIGLINYYNNFLENGLFSIEEIIKGLEDINTRITYKDFEDMGIRKPGHIYRILVKLEMDAKYIDESVIQMIFDRTKITETKCNTLNMPNYSLKFSGDKYVCCGLMNKVSQINKNTSINFNNNTKSVVKYDLITWLKHSNLPHLRKNFLHNGFDSIEYFILQMFSSFPFDDLMIEDCLHVYSKKERKIILSQLNREVMSINNRLLNITDMDSNNYDSDSSVKVEKTKIDDGCKMCTIF